jgi:hypothetical protein
MRSSAAKIQADQNSGTCSAIDSTLAGHNVKGSIAVPGQLLGPRLNSLRVETAMRFANNG